MSQASVRYDAVVHAVEPSRAAWATTFFIGLVRCCPFDGRVFCVRPGSRRVYCDDRCRYLAREMRLYDGAEVARVAVVRLHNYGEAVPAVATAARLKEKRTWTSRR